MDGEPWPYGATALIANVVDSDPAYMLYTSGSTGTPKGCYQPPHALTFIECPIATFGIRPEDRAVVATAADFDLSVFDIYAALGTAHVS